MKRIDFQSATINVSASAGAIFSMVKESPVLVSCNCGVRVWFARQDTIYNHVRRFVREHSTHGEIIAEDMELVYSHPRPDEDGLK